MLKLVTKNPRCRNKRYNLKGMILYQSLTAGVFVKECFPSKQNTDGIADIDRCTKNKLGDGCGPRQTLRIHSLCEVHHFWNINLTLVVEILVYCKTCETLEKLI